MNVYVIRRDLEKCEELCQLCCDVIPSLRAGPVKLAGWAYKHNKNCLENLQAECPTHALRIDRL